MTFNFIETSDFLNLPPPDRAVMMQSPPPSVEDHDSTVSFEVEEAPYNAGPIDFMPEARNSDDGKLIFKAKFMKAPTIIIESE